MSDPVFGDKQIEFPVEVHFRVIALANDATESGVAAAAASLGLAEGMQKGNASQNGKYQTHTLSVVVESKARLHEIDAAFRAVPGVKMVL